MRTTHSRLRRAAAVLFGGALTAAMLVAPTSPAQATPVQHPKTKNQGHAVLTPTKAVHDAQRKTTPSGPGADGTTDMAYHGGSVMREVTNYLIFWNPTTPPTGAPTPLFGANYRSTIERYFHDISNTPYFNILTQYGDNTAAPVPATTHFGGTWVDTTTYPHAGSATDPLVDGDIRASVARAVTANPTWQTDQLSTMYFVFTGKNILECDGPLPGSSCFAAKDYNNNSITTAKGGFCAYHWNNSGQVYGFIPYASTGSCYGDQTAFPNGVDQDIALTATSHEQFEAYTDPYGDAWFDDVDKGAGENGDKCAYNESPYEDSGANLVLNGHQYQIQKEWSNGSPHGCVKRYGPRPELQITGDLSFGTVKRGTSATKQLALQNTGAGDLDVLDVKLATGSSSAFSISPASPNTATLAQGDTSLVNVTFSPPSSASTSTPFNASLVVDSDDTVPNDTGQPTNAQLTDVRTVAASGIAGIPEVKVSGSLDFGTVPRGTTATRNVVVQNIGTGDLAISNVSLVAADSAYSISPSSPTSGTLPPGDSLTVQVVFSPPANATTPGPRVATLRVASGDPNNPQIDVPATGTVGLPKVAISPASLNFGVVCPGSSSDLQVTVTNTGTAPLTISNVSIGGGSSAGLSVQSPPTLPQTLAIGAHLSFTVRFAPAGGTLGGPIAGTVVVDTDDPNNPSVSAPITGTVGAAVITVGSNQLDFGGVPTDNRTSPHAASLPLSLSNTGTCAVSIASLAVSGPAAADYTVSGPPTLPLVLAPGSSVTITVTFNPTAAGVRNGVLTITSSDLVHPSVTVALTGRGLVPAILATPASLTFGPTVVLSQGPAGYKGATQSTEVTNTGQSELIVDSMAASSPFSAPGPASPPSRFAPNNHFSEAVTFGPTAVGKYLGNLTISDNDPEGGASLSTPLCGEGVTRGIRVLAVNAAGTSFAMVAALKLQSHGTAQNVNENKKNLPVVAVPTSCTAGQQRQYENQSLPATDTVNQRSSYYTLSVTAGGKSTTITFTLGVTEFKTLTVTIK
jgi:hypothetical protein